MRFPSYKQPIQRINDDLYLIVAEYPIDKVRDAVGIKHWLGCDNAFKSNQTGSYLFCNKIEEAKIINE